MHEAGARVQGIPKGAPVSCARSRAPGTALPTPLDSRAAGELYLGGDPAWVALDVRPILALIRRGHEARSRRNEARESRGRSLSS
jgi:hypothetical protein